MDKLNKPDPEEFEREQRDLFQYSDISDTSKHSGIRYGSLSKQLNPSDPTPSIATEFLMFLFGCRMTRPELEERVWALVSRHRQRMFPAAPRRDAVGIGDALRTFGDLCAVSAELDDGLCPPEKFEEAKQRHIDTAERVTVYKPINHLRNAD